MNARELIGNVIALFLLPAGLAVASFALRGRYGAALCIYSLALVLTGLARSESSVWSSTNGYPRAVQAAFQRVFFLLVLTTLNVLGSCPTWFLALMIATTLLQWTVFFLIRPSRLAAPLLPEITLWNSLAQALIPGIFLCDLLLIQAFPNNFRFSETFHLAGYALLASLKLMQLAHDSYRMRRTFVFWMRALAFQAQ